ncbi:Protein of unknown function [Bacillus toyonensis]|nr:Protein of unknown function [Bacillus toyonensis]
MDLTVYHDGQFL